VWQDFYAQHQGQGFELLAVAIDFQGAGRARPYVEAAGATFANAVDTENQLGLLMGFTAIPNLILVDEVGIIRYARFGRFDIRKEEDWRMVERFLIEPGAGELERSAAIADAFQTAEALEQFHRGMAHYREGRVAEALAAWRQVAVLEPRNWVVRKQVWAIEHPERFYEGAVDYDWQKEQVDQNR